MKNLILVLCFLYTGAVSFGQDKDYIVREGNDTTYCKIKRIRNNRIFFIYKGKEKLYNELSDVLVYKRFDNECVYPKMDKDSITDRDLEIMGKKNIRFGVALGTTSYILPGVYGNWHLNSYYDIDYGTINKLYPYYSTDTINGAESFRNAFGYINRLLPIVDFSALTKNDNHFGAAIVDFVDFSALTKNDNHFGAAIGYRNSFVDLGDHVVYSASIKLKSYNAYFQYGRLFVIDSNNKKRNFLYAGAKVSGYYKELNYGWSNLSKSGTDRNLKYEENSLLGLLQLSPGYRGQYAKIILDIGLSFNLFAVASGKHHTKYYENLFPGVSEINITDDYFKTFFMKQGFIFNDFTIKVGYLF